MKNMIQWFNSLSTEEKREKLLAVLHELQDSNEIFSSLFTKLSDSSPNDATLVVIYYDIMMFGQAIEEYNKSQDASSLSKAEQYMQNLLKREQQDRLTDAQDIEKMEDLLENI